MSKEQVNKKTPKGEKSVARSIMKTEEKSIAKSISKSMVAKSTTRSMVITPEVPDVRTDDMEGIKKEDKRLSVDPEVGEFLESGGKQEFMLVNTTDTALAVKIKCSNNAMYRVMPVHIAIEKSQIATLTVTRLPGPAKNDKLVAAYCPMVDGIKDPKEAITKHEAKGKCQIIRIMLKVVNAEDLSMPDPSREAIS